MTTNLRLSLTILSVGFAIEGGGELYSFVSRGTFQPGPNLLFVLPALMTLVGLLFVWVGRHEWNVLHHDRVRGAHLVFALSLLGGAVGGALVGLLVALPGLGIPAWAALLFGASLGSLVLGTFVTYVYLVFHLVSRPSQVVLVASIVWALLISVFIAAAFASNLGAIVGLAAHRSFTIPAFLQPVNQLASYLFVSYFLLLAAYVVAHHRVAQGPGRQGSVPPSPGPTPSERSGSFVAPRRAPPATSVGSPRPWDPGPGGDSPVDPASSDRT